MTEPSCFALKSVRELLVAMLLLVAATPSAGSGRHALSDPIMQAVPVSRHIAAQEPSLCTRVRRLCLRGGADTFGEHSIPDNTPCIGELQNFRALEEFYSVGDSNEIFRQKLLDLKCRYQVGYRPVKGDGNCFIRGYVFGLLESLLSKPSSEASGFRGKRHAPPCVLEHNTEPATLEP